MMLKIADSPYQHALDYSLHGKSRSEVYGFMAGIFKRIGICQTLGTTTSDFLDLLIDIEREYNDNPYHSFYHAVDVAMVLYHMLEEYGMSEYLNRFDLAMLMLAALFHDIGHVSGVCVCGYRATANTFLHRSPATTTTLKCLATQKEPCSTITCLSWRAIPPALHCSFSKSTTI